MHTAGNYSATFVWEFFSESGWTSFTPDNLPGFLSAGETYLGFEEADLTGWIEGDINSVTAYWVRVRITGTSVWTANPVQGYQTLFKNDYQRGPTIVGNVRNSLTFNDWSERWAIGNLRGLYGYSANAYGVAFGRYQDTSSYLTIDSTDGIRIINRVSGANTTVFHANMSGVTTIGNWIVDEYVLSDSNNYVVLKSGNDSSYGSVAGRILIDGYNAGLSYGVIQVGTGVDIIGQSAGKITVGNVVIDGASPGKVATNVVDNDRVELHEYYVDMINSSNVVGRIQSYTLAVGGLLINPDIAQTGTSKWELLLNSTGGGMFYNDRGGPVTEYRTKVGAATNSAGNIIWTSFRTDTYNVFSINYLGKLQWNYNRNDYGWDVNLYADSTSVLRTDDTFRAAGYQSSDGTAGMTDTIDLTGATTLTVKNGLITEYT
jgi:hypothetical protein